MEFRYGSRHTPGRRLVNWAGAALMVAVTAGHPSKTYAANRDAPAAAAVPAARGKPRLPAAVTSKAAQYGDHAKMTEINKAAKLLKEPYFLELLENDDFASLFVAKPMATALDLVRISKCIHYGSGTSDATRENIEFAFDSLGDENVSKLATLNLGAFVSIACNVRGNTWRAYDTLKERRTAGLFVTDPSSFVSIAASAGPDAHIAYQMLAEPPFAEAFARDPSAVARAFADVSPQVLLQLKGNPNLREPLLKQHDAITWVLGHAEKGMPGPISAISGKNIDDFVVSSVSLHDEVSIELGRPIDDLAVDAGRRAAYLSSLSVPKVVGLLCSNPFFFSKATNGLLFDSLAEKLPGGIAKILEKHNLSDTQMRNLILRAARHDRLGSLVSKEGRTQDTKVVKEAMLGTALRRTGIYADNFDERYFYLLVSGIEKLGAHLPGIGQELDARVRALSTNTSRSREQNTILRALKYTRSVFSGNAADPAIASFGIAKALFDPGDYFIDGKVTVLQLFDREDTEKKHWELSNTWFSHLYGRPKKGEHGELIYENNRERVIHFMGATNGDNERFARVWLREHDRGIIALRADISHLEMDMPYTIFGNRPGRFLFINGACGSAAHDNAYTERNPITDVKFVSNVSTGKGQVTNAEVQLLLKQKTAAKLADVIAAGSKLIVLNGGDPATIKTSGVEDGLHQYVLETTDTAPPSMKTTRSR